MGLKPRMLVEGARQQGLQGIEFRKVAKFRGAYGLLGEVVAQHEAWVGFKHQIGCQRFIIKRQQLFIR